MKYGKIHWSWHSEVDSTDINLSQLVTQSGKKNSRDSAPLVHAILIKVDGSRVHVRCGAQTLSSEMHRMF